MVDDVKTPARATAQVYKFYSPSATAKVLKDLGPNGANPGNAIQDNAFEPEDEYQQLYVGATRDQGIIQPPYNLRQLDRLSQDNNALGPCIEALVTNIDGTGYEFVSEDALPEDDADDAQIEELKQFFEEPWPGMSFTTMRKLMRRDLERTGNAFFEILRNAQDEICFVRRVDAKMMRMLRLDDAVPVAQTVMRGGKEVSINVMTRERRYCQLVNGVSLMYFKEFGSKRDLHKKTAVWAPPGQRFPATARATEIMHLIVLPDSHTPYGIPRWVNQTPSVLGSRKAEEFNLEFFDNGGVPPVMILLQGGTLQAETRTAIERMNAGSAAKNNRLQVLEVEATGGTVDSTPSAKVTVERFGADRTKDSMFEDYDDKCEARVRRSFRLPPIFVGQSKDYNFATAFASYVVAEAQVFAPEREEFDELMSMRLLPAMGYDGYKMRSKPMVIEDATLKLQGVEVAMGLQQVEPADIVAAINEIVGLKLKVSANAMDLGAQQAQQQQQQDQAHQQAMAQAQGGGPATHTLNAMGQIKPIKTSPTDPSTMEGASPKGPGLTGSSVGALKAPPPPAMLGAPAPGKSPGTPGGKGGNPFSKGGNAFAKSEDAVPGTGLELAHDMLLSLRKRDFVALTKSMSIFNSLDVHAQDRVAQATNDLFFLDPSLDPQGLAELSACTLAVMSGQPHSH